VRLRPGHPSKVAHPAARTDHPDEQHSRQWTATAKRHSNAGEYNYRPTRAEGGHTDPALHNYQCPEAPGVIRGTSTTTARTRNHPEPGTGPTALRRTAGSEEARKTLTELFGESLSDLSEDEHAPDTSPSCKGESGSNARVPATTEPQPAGPPPVIVTVSGISIPVPYYAIHTSRRYKARVGSRRFALRFDRARKLRSHREL